MRNQQKQFSLHELIHLLDAPIHDLIDQVVDQSNVAAALPIVGARALDLAEPNQLSFSKNELPQFVAGVLNSRSRFIVARPPLLDSLPPEFIASHAFVLTAKPRLVLAHLIQPFDAPPQIASQDGYVNSKAKIAESSLLSPGVVIGEDVEIGPNCVIGPNTYIDHATIGPDTHIGPNCSIGGDGFGLEIDEPTGEIIKFPHFGRIYIGSNVDIFANVCIARGSLRDTIIEDDVKIDNLVHVAHNCHVKRGAFLIANAMLGGSATIGEYAWIAPSTALLNGISVGRCAMTGMGAVVTKDVEDNALVVGTPARKIRERFPADSPLLKD